MLKAHELDSQNVTLDGVGYTVTKMTVRKRTAFEATLVKQGTERIREAMLVFCVLLDGLPAFDPADKVCDLTKDQLLLVESAETKKHQDELTSELRLANLFDYLGEFPSTQLEPLVLAAQAVNELLGNDSTPS
jgi:hypothetical protein